MPVSGAKILVLGAWAALFMISLIGQSYAVPFNGEVEYAPAYTDCGDGAAPRFLNLQPTGGDGEIFLKLSNEADEAKRKHIIVGIKQGRVDLRYDQFDCATQKYSSNSTSTTVDPPRDKRDDGCNSPSRPVCAVGNPIDAIRGEKTQAETDFVSSASVGLSFARTYSSFLQKGNIAFPSPIGNKWRSNWDRSLEISAPGGLVLGVTANRPGGQGYWFIRTGILTFFTGRDARLTLSLITAGGVQTGYKLVTPEDDTEIYDTNGKLLSITSRSGRVTSLSYDAAGRVTQVTGPFGHKLTFSFNASNRIASMTAPDGGVYAYAYDGAGNLVSVSYPDGRTRRYAYQDMVNSYGGYPSMLRSIADEKNVVFASFAYSAGDARANLSVRAGGVDRTTVSGPIDNGAETTVDVTGPLGETYSFHIHNAEAFPGSQTKPSSITGAPVQSTGGKAFSYDNNGFISSRTDWNGNVTTYLRDDRGNETSRTEASGTPLARTVTTSWHPTFRLPTRMVEPGRITSFTYDTKGNLLTKTIASGGQTRSYSYTYSAAGQVLTATDPRGNVTTYAYDARGNLASVTNALGHVTSFTSYDGAGRLLRSVDPNGVVTTLTYDLRGRLTSRTEGALTTRYAYDPVGNLTRVTQPDGAFLAFSYDAAHRLIGVADAVGARVAYALDRAGNVAREQVFDSADVLRRVQWKTYDSVSRLIQSIGAQGQTAKYAYDLKGNVTSFADPLGKTAALSYDALNRIVRIIDPAGGAIALSYDVLDRLASVTDPRGVKTSYGWTGFGEERAVSSPDAGYKSRTFDAAGNALTATDARGTVATYAYDALNRKVSETFPNGTTTTWQYDQGPNGKGRLTGITDPSGSTSYDYDANGHVVRKVNVIGGLTRITRYLYDTQGRLGVVITPLGRQIRYAHDAAGRVTGISNGAQTLISGVTYAPFGGVTGWTLGNGATYSRTLDRDYRVTGLGFPGGRSISLAYDGANRITETADSALGVSTFYYDALDRLTNFSRNSVRQAFSYDATGNRMSAFGFNGVTLSTFNYSYAAASNRLFSIGGAWNETFGYDAAGNTIRHDTPPANYTFAYDARGRLARATVGALAQTYSFNALGQRALKRNPANGPERTYFVYDEAGHIAGEYSYNGNGVQETVWLGDLPVATLQPAGVGFIAPDHLGAPSEITNASQQVVWLWNHSPFGNGVPSESQGFSYNLRYPGQYYDKETKLHHNYFRDYDPNLGRYIQSDPIGMNGGLNSFAYVNANPVSRVDQLGLSFADFFSFLYSTILNTWTGWHTGGQDASSAFVGAASALPGAGMTANGLDPNLAGDVVTIIKERKRREKCLEDVLKE